MTRLNKWLASSAAIALLGAIPAQGQESGVTNDIVVTAPAAIGEFGIDLTARDTSVKPGDDFEKYASGTWIAKTPIPADRPSIGAFDNLYEDVQAQLQTLVTEAPKGTKYGALYAAFMDEKAVERAGLAPLMRDIAEVRAVADKREFARFMASTYYRFGINLFDFAIDADTADPTTNIFWMGQGGLGLPEKDYYFNPQFATQREAYRAYIARTMKTLGAADPAAAAGQIMAFETEIAALSWDLDDRRQIEKINNPIRPSELEAYAPGSTGTRSSPAPGSRRRSG